MVNPLSEFILQRKLHLPRRPGIASREASSGDYAKGVAIYLRRASGLPEVRVIEHVKHFPTEFNHLPFSQLRALDQRQVRVVETWSNNHISSEVAEMVDGPVADGSNRQNHDRARRALTAGPRIADRR